MPQPEKLIALLSGGIDSTVALYEAVERGYQVTQALAFDYGSKHNAEEWKRAVRTADGLGIFIQRIRLDFMALLFKSDLLLSGDEIPEGHYEAETMKKTVVPFRNGILLSIAVGLAESQEADGVLIGNHSGDHAIYPDCRESFIDALSAASMMGTYRMIKIRSPFVRSTKADIVRRGHDLGVDFSQTYSCYKGGEIHCGKCSTCVERIEAFHLAEVPDPTQYLAPKAFALSACGISS